MRRFPALLGAAALVVAALAGCSAAGSTSAEYSAGNASTTITSTGAVFSAPTVTFPTPLLTSGSQVSVLVPGTGDPIARGAQVDYEYSVYYGPTGQTLAQSSYGAAAASSTTAPYRRGAAGLGTSSLNGALVGAKVGERLALTTTAADAYGAGKLASSSIADGDTLVIVMDIRAVYPGKSDGVNLLPQDGMPAVATEVDGRPGLSILSGLTIPSGTRSETVKAGGGATLQKGNNIVAHFSLWTWPTGTQTAPVATLSSWDANSAVSWTLTSIADGGGLPAGLVNSLVGQQVGSQVLIVIPPGADGFPSANLPTGVTADSTIVFVVDLLAVVG